MSLTLEQRHAEAERLLNEPLLINALAALTEDAIRKIVDAEGEHADRVRQEQALLLRILETIPSVIRNQMLVVEAEMKPRGMVA